MAVASCFVSTQSSHRHGSLSLNCACIILYQGALACSIYSDGDASHQLSMLTLQADRTESKYAAVEVSAAPRWKVQGLSPVHKLLLCQLVLDHELCKVANHLRTQAGV